jgi:hypothetical protein
MHGDESLEPRGVTSGRMLGSTSALAAARVEGAPMYVAAIHTISDPEKFWSADPSAIPADVTLLSTFPKEDRSRALCLWEADSVETVQSLVDAMAGDAAKNECFEVDEHHPWARGIPRAAARTA